MRSPRRNERHPSLVRVETVNGAPAEPPEQRPWFGDLIAVVPAERLSMPATLESVPFGKGSRVAVSGPAGAGATTLLREVAKALSEQYPDSPCPWCSPARARKRWASGARAACR